MPGSPSSQVHSAMVGEFNWSLEFVVSILELPHQKVLSAHGPWLPMVAGIQLLRLWVSSTGPLMEAPLMTFMCRGRHKLYRTGSLLSLVLLNAQ